MSLTEAEELELLELEEQEHLAKVKSKPVETPRPSYGSQVESAFMPNVKKLSDTPREPGIGGYLKRSFVDVPLAALSDVGSLPSRALGAATGQGAPSDMETKPSNFITKNLDTSKPLGRIAKSTIETVTDPASYVGIGLGSKVLSKTLPAYKEVNALNKYGAEAAKEFGPKPATLGTKLQDAGNRIETVSVKLNAPEVKQGAKPEYFGKYNLFGKAKDVQASAHAQIQEAATQLKDVISKASDDPANRVDVLAALDKAQARILETSTYGRDKTRKIIDEAMNDLIDKYGNNIQGLDLADAQILKQQTGKQGAWYELPMGGKAADDSNVKSQVYNTIYDELKKELETKGGPEVKELNRKMSELIPMEMAAAKRAMVEQRKNPISLDDFLGGLAVAGGAATGNLLPAAMAGANLLSKSPNVAKGLYKFGSSLENRGTLGTIGKIAGTAPIRTGIGAAGGAAAGYATGDTPEDRLTRAGQGAIAGAGAGLLATPQRINTLSKTLIKRRPLDGLGKTLGNERGAVGVENPQIHTENFKKWFGDFEKTPEKASKVVDESGKPLVVYHGTGADFNVFDNSKNTRRTTKIGIEKETNSSHWFAQNSAVTNFFANGGVRTPKGVLYPGAKIMDTYLDIKNPLVVDMQDFKNIPQVKETKTKALRSKKEGRIQGDNGPQYLDKEIYDIGAIKEQMVKKAKKEGRDGLIFKNGYDFRPYDGDIYAVFNSNQIKSATGNSGAFNPKNPDIRGNTALPMLGITGGIAAGGLTGFKALDEYQKRKQSKK